MMVAVSSTGGSLDDEVDPRFGRCAQFLIVDTESMEFRPIANDGAGAMGGAGIRAAQSVIDAGAEAVLTGQVGPNAFSTLSAGGIRVYTGAAGRIRDAVENLAKGMVAQTDTPTVGSHAGKGGGGRRGF